MSWPAYLFRLCKVLIKIELVPFLESMFSTFPVPTKRPLMVKIHNKIQLRFCSNDLLFQISISTSNHMFGRAIWDKLPECISENFEFSKCSEITRVICSSNCPNQTCGYLLITSNQEKLCTEMNIFYKSASGQLQNSERNTK